MNVKLMPDAPTAARLRICPKCGVEYTVLVGMGRFCSECRVLKLTSPEKRVINGTSLSSREQQVVQLVCEAKPNKEIACLLHLTEGTIKVYLNRIFTKTGFGNRTDLALDSLRKSLDTALILNGRMRGLQQAMNEGKDVVVIVLDPTQP